MSFIDDETFSDRTHDSDIVSLKKGSIDVWNQDNFSPELNYSFLVLDEVFENPLCEKGKQFVLCMMYAYQSFKVLFNLKHCRIEDLNVDKDDILWKQMVEFKEIISFYERYKKELVFYVQDHLMESVNEPKESSKKAFRNLVKSGKKIVLLNEFLSKFDQSFAIIKAKKKSKLTFDPAIFEENEEMSETETSLKLQSKNQENYHKTELNLDLPPTKDSIELNKHVFNVIMNDYKGMDSLRIAYGYSKTRLSDLCKNLFRTLKQNNSIVKYLEKQNIKENVHFKLLNEFVDIFKMTKRKLHMDVLEENVKCLYLDHSKDRLANYQKIYRILQEVKEKVKNEEDVKLKEIETNIRNLRLQTITNQSVFTEYSERIINNKEDIEFVESMEQFCLLAKLKANNLEQMCNEVFNTNWSKEMRLKERRDMLKVNVSNVINDCRTLTQTYNEQISALSIENDIRELTLTDLENVYFPLESRYEKVLEKREKEKNQLRSEEIIQERRLQATHKLQNWWRRHKISKKRRLTAFRSTKNLFTSHESNF